MQLLHLPERRLCACPRIRGGPKHPLCLPVMALSDHPELKKSLTPPLIIHTAATPMPMPKSAVFGEAAQGHESRRASGVSMDPAAYELKSPVRTSSILWMLHGHLPGSRGCFVCSSHVGTARHGWVARC